MWGNQSTGLPYIAFISVLLSAHVNTFSGLQYTGFFSSFINVSSFKAFPGNAKFHHCVTLVVVAEGGWNGRRLECGGRSGITRPKQSLHFCHSVCTIYFSIPTDKFFNKKLKLTAKYNEVCTFSLKSPKLVHRLEKDLPKSPTTFISGISTF